MSCCCYKPVLNAELITHCVRRYNDDGTIRWTGDIGRHGSGWPVCYCQKIVMGDDCVYALLQGVSEASKVCCYDLETGELLWDTYDSLFPNLAFMDLLLVEDRVVVLGRGTGSDLHFQAFSADDGEVLVDKELTGVAHQNCTLHQWLVDSENLIWMRSNTPVVLDTSGNVVASSTSLAARLASTVQTDSEGIDITGVTGYSTSAAMFGGTLQGMTIQDGTIHASLVLERQVGYGGVEPRYDTQVFPVHHVTLTRNGGGIDMAWASPDFGSDSISNVGTCSGSQGNWRIDVEALTERPIGPRNSPDYTYSPGDKRVALRRDKVAYAGVELITTDWRSKNTRYYNTGGSLDPWVKYWGGFTSLYWHPGADAAITAATGISDPNPNYPDHMDYSVGAAGSGLNFGGELADPTCAWDPTGMTSVGDKTAATATTLVVYGEDEPPSWGASHVPGFSHAHSLKLGQNPIFGGYSDKLKYYPWVHHPVGQRYATPLQVVYNGQVVYPLNLSVGVYYSGWGGDLMCTVDSDTVLMRVPQLFLAADDSTVTESVEWRYVSVADGVATIGPALSLPEQMKYVSRALNGNGTKALCSGADQQTKSVVAQVDHATGSIEWASRWDDRTTTAALAALYADGGELVVSGGVSTLRPGYAPVTGTP